MKRFINIKLFFLVTISLLSANIYSQNNLSGIVLDGKSKAPVSGANIFVENSKAGTSSNGYGEFQIKSLNDGVYNIDISHIGYHDTILNIKINQDLRIEVYLIPDSIEIASIIVTATRTRNTEEKIPQRVHIIKQESIELFPATSTDDLLKMIPGVVVNRSWGIFSRNAAVSMRGMPGSSRSLILLDGVPLNKIAGGTVNWHLVTPGEVERIEIVKGPGSSIYGMNAMGGTINLITKRPEKKLSGSAGLGYGSYNTFKAQLNLLGNNFEESKGLYWKLGGFYRQGDGYVLEPEEQRDEYSSKAHLQEGNFSGLVGYQFKKNQKLELDYRFFKDKRGSGVTVFEEDGSYESFTNNNFRGGYDCFLGKTKLTTKGFYFSELYNRQSEKVNSSNEYKLVDTKTAKQDLGAWITFSRSINLKHRLVWGIDIKNGTLDNEEIYRTSTDEIYTNGKLLFSGLYLQDEMNFLKNKLNIIAGLRLDHAYFHDGWIKVNNPTSNTGFPAPLDDALPESTWLQPSPKLSARYFIRESISTYISASSGFMPPKLDDLAGSRKIRKGFKMANPDLKPEVINSFELGFDMSFWDKFSVKPTGFYSIGKDFQYLVATGDIIDEDSDDPITVFQRQNVSKVEVAGFELGLEYNLNQNIKLSGSYAYNYSKILEYSSPDGTDYTGKVLNEVPENLVYAGLDWKNKIADIHLDFTYTDDQWYDEENTEIIEGYSLLNLRISKMITKNLVAILDIQDLLDEQFIDRKGYLSPGRFIMFEINYLLK